MDVTNQLDVPATWPALAIVCLDEWAMGTSPNTVEVKKNSTCHKPPFLGQILVI